MKTPVDSMDLLARLVRYPDADLCALVAEASEAFADAGEADLALALRTFGEICSQNSNAEIAEIFTRTFDLSAACALELGWHLFGESYDRGLYLVWMRKKLRGFGIVESSDLPDHFSYALRILARLDDDDASHFVRLCILPALAKITLGFKETDNPYQPLLGAIVDFLTQTFGPAAVDTNVSLPMYTQHEELFSMEGA